MFTTLGGARALTSNAVLKGFVAREQQKAIEERGSVEKADSKKNEAWTAVQEIVSQSIEDDHLTDSQLKILIKAKVGPRGGISCLKTKTERLAKWKEVKDSPWHQSCIAVTDDTQDEGAGALPYATELDALGITPAPLNVPIAPVAQLAASVGAAVDAMPSLSDLDAFIALAKNRKMALTAAIQGGSGVI
jgi:hypothetical protein